MVHSEYREIHRSVGTSRTTNALYKERSPRIGYGDSFVPFIGCLVRLGRTPHKAKVLVYSTRTSMPERLITIFIFAGSGICVCFINEKPPYCYEDFIAPNRLSNLIVVSRIISYLRLAGNATYFLKNRAEIWNERLPYNCGLAQQGGQLKIIAHGPVIITVYLYT